MAFRNKVEFSPGAFQYRQGLPNGTRLAGGLKPAPFMRLPMLAGPGLSKTSWSRGPWALSFPELAAVRKAEGDKSESRGKENPAKELAVHSF